MLDAALLQRRKAFLCVWSYPAALVLKPLYCYTRKCMCFSFTQICASCSKHAEMAIPSANIAHGVG